MSRGEKVLCGQFVYPTYNTYINLCLRIFQHTPRTYPRPSINKLLKELFSIWGFGDAKGVCETGVCWGFLRYHPNCFAWFQFYLMISYPKITPPETNCLPLKMDGWNTTVVSCRDGLFSGALAVSFREAIPPKKGGPSFQQQGACNGPLATASASFGLPIWGIVLQGRPLLVIPSLKLR